MLEALNRLIPQLSRSAPLLDATTLAEVLADQGNVVLIARDASDRIVGSMTLVLFRIPTGMRGWIEDVVVDEAASRQGIGEALNTAALDEARRRGSKDVSLTSRPSREAANRLYQRIGFELRETNVYRYKL